MHLAAGVGGDGFPIVPEQVDWLVRRDNKATTAEKVSVAALRSSCLLAYGTNRSLL